MKIYALFSLFFVGNCKLAAFRALRKKRKREKRGREREEGSGRGIPWLRSLCQVEIVPKSRPDKNVK